MNSRAEVTTRYAKAYVKAAKGDKGRILDEVVGVAGRSRWRAGSGGRRSIPTTVSDNDAVKMLQRVWAASGGQCGKYLAASMRLQLYGLERHGELVDGVDRYGPAVRGELLAMSAASIDRYLKPAKAPTGSGVSPRRRPPACGYPCSGQLGSSNPERCRDRGSRKEPTKLRRPSR
jgi:hypothetical protein